MEPNKYYRLFAPCIPVKGFRRSVIADLNRHQLFYIPNKLYQILTRGKNRTWSDLMEKYGDDNLDTLTSYFDFLLQNELIFPFNKEELAHFPSLSLQWDFPSLCSNAILDIDEKSAYDIAKAIAQFDEISCFHLQIRFFRTTSLEEIKRLLTFSNDTSIRSVQLMLKFDTAIDSHLQPLYDEFWKLVKVEVFESPENQVIPLKGNLGLLAHYKQKKLHPNNCGAVSTDYFCIEMNHFTESQHHNTCLNRKVCIDANGDIKNCPAMAKSYGNIRDTTLEEAINKPGFKNLWFINKDKIDVCKDCEFRYMCTDCRAFIKDPENIYSQPAKCTYNPYICLWEGQEGYVPVEECGTYSRETGFVPDKKRIKELNRKIWGDE